MRACAGCKRRPTFGALRRGVWLHVLVINHDEAVYCPECSPAALDDWGGRVTTWRDLGLEDAARATSFRVFYRDPDGRLCTHYLEVPALERVGVT